MAEHYYTVGKHGPPTKETAPHGYMWRAPMNDNVMGPWMAAGAGAHVADQRAEWYPLPAPPTEQAPPPEPVARWKANESPGKTHARLTLDNCDVMTCEDARAAADALNAFDRDGVAWGPGRPMSELPDGHPEPVLIGYDGVVGIDHRTDRGNDAQYDRRCWWPLPGEAP